VFGMRCDLTMACGMCAPRSAQQAAARVLAFIGGLSGTFVLGVWVALSL
jgi:hypothetical protein